MRVKVGGTLSQDVPVTGGAVQGSILGVMDHNAVLEGIDDDYDQQTEKYVDDLTLYEPICGETPGLDMGDGTEMIRAVQTQCTMGAIQEACEVKDLKINDKKTQLLAISGKKEQKSLAKNKGRLYYNKC